MGEEGALAGASASSHIPCQVVTHVTKCRSSPPNEPFANVVPLRRSSGFALFPEKPSPLQKILPRRCGDETVGFRRRLMKFRRRPDARFAPTAHSGFIDGVAR